MHTRSVRTVPFKTMSELNDGIHQVLSILIEVHSPRGPVERLATEVTHITEKMDTGEYIATVVIDMWREREAQRGHQ